MQSEHIGSVSGAGRRAWGPRLLILAGVALLVATVAWFAILAPLRDPVPLPIPARLAGLPLTRHAFGRPPTRLPVSTTVVSP